MKKLQKLLVSGIITGFFSLGLCYAAMATDAIVPVNLSVKVDVEAGDRLPDININEKEGTYVTTTSQKFEIEKAEWAGSLDRDLKIGEEPRMNVTLVPLDETDAYFKTDYKSSEIKISGGTYVSSRKDGRDLVVTLKVKAITGIYDAPEDAYWKDTKLGTAEWEVGSNTSGAYEVQLYKGSKSVHKVDLVRGKSFNFYPYMTEEGVYKFKVRTVPYKEEEKSNGKKSDWVESGELNITARYVSDGTGRGSENDKKNNKEPVKIGWVKENGIWYYYFTDGSFQQSGWLEMDDNWYLFGADGRMLTGWQILNGVWYYMADNGAMLTGWAKIGNNWYYLNPGAEGIKGAMVSGWHSLDGSIYYFDNSGAMFKGWLLHENKWYYFNELEGSLEGAMFKGWINRGGKSYFTGKDGVMLTGWQEIGYNWYYFDPTDGAMAVNRTIDGFYVGEDGIWQK